MNERVKYPIVITLICLVAAAGLALTFALTKDKIAESKAKEFNEGLSFVLPKGTPELLDKTANVYVARKDDDVVGYAATGEAQGYSSKIKVIVGVDPEMNIIAIRVLSQQETPGLGEQTKDVPPTKTIWRAISDALAGGKADPKLEPPFQKQFRGKTWNQLQLTKRADSKDAISQLTGATVTSQAVVNAVKNAITAVEAALGHDEDEDGEQETEEEEQ